MAGKGRSWGLVGGGLVVFGALAFPVAWHPYSIACEQGGDCVVASTGLVQPWSGRFPAAELEGARVEWLETGKGRKSVVTIVSANQTFTLPRLMGDGDAERATLAARIEGRVREGKLTFRIEDPDHGTAFACALAVLVGAAMVAFALLRRPAVA